MHMCEGMKRALETPGITLYYDQVDRTFGNFVLQNCLTPREQVYVGRLGLILAERMCLDYCPWCAALLPGRLREMRYDILTGEIGLDIPDEWKNPPEFNTSQWWQDRGIGYDEGERTLLPFSPDEDYEFEDWSGEAVNGYWRAADRPPHMCDGLEDSFSAYKNMLSYLPHLREYGFRIVDFDRQVIEQDVRIYPVHYCPWCATELPASLADEWRKRVRALDLPEDISIHDPSLPEPLRSSRWWVEAGL